MTSDTGPCQGVQSIGLAAVLGGFVGLAESVFLHLASPSPFRDRWIFLIAFLVYGLLSALLMLLIRLSLRLLRRSQIGLAAPLALLISLLFAMEYGVTGKAGRWHGPLIEAIGPGHPRRGWAVLAFVGGAVCFGLLWWLLSRAPVASRLERLSRGKLLAILLALGGAVALLASALTASTAAADTDRQNIVVMVMDTTRADAIGCYGYLRPGQEPNGTPNINGLAKTGWRYANAHSQAPYTQPSHATLFTGLYVTQHGASFPDMPLPEGYHTIAELLRDQGYNTVAFSNNNAVVKKAMGFAQGFNQFFEMWDMSADDVLSVQPPSDYPVLRLFALFAPDASADDGRADEAYRPVKDNGAMRTSIMATRWMARYRSKKPFFMFINFLEPHAPYAPPAGWFKGEMPAAPPTDPYAAAIWQDLTQGIERESEEQSWQEARKTVVAAYDRYSAGTVTLGKPYRKAARALYDAEVRYLDSEMGKIFDAMRASGRMDDTYLVITSDHGENFGEHGRWLHTHHVDNTLTRVPLIVHHPTRLGAPRTIDRPVQGIDLFPTIEAWIGSQEASDLGKRFGTSLLADGARPETYLMTQNRFVTAPSALGVVQTSKGSMERLKARVGEVSKKEVDELLKKLPAEPADLRESVGALFWLKKTDPEYEAKMKRLADYFDARPGLIEYLYRYDEYRIGFYDQDWKLVWRSGSAWSLYRRADRMEKDDLLDPGTPEHRAQAEVLYQRLKAYMEQEKFSPADISRVLKLPEAMQQDQLRFGY